MSTQDDLMIMLKESPGVLARLKGHQDNQFLAENVRQDIKVAVVVVGVAKSEVLAMKAKQNGYEETIAQLQNAIAIYCREERDETFENDQEAVEWFVRHHIDLEG